MTTTTPTRPARVIYGDRMTELASVLDQMNVFPYNHPPAKLQKAYEAVLEERVSAAPTAGVYHVTTSTEAGHAYQVEGGQCMCPYGRAHRDTPYPCHHTVAARLYQRWQQAISPLWTPKETTMSTTTPGDEYHPPHFASATAIPLTGEAAVRALTGVPSHAGPTLAPMQPITLTSTGGPQTPQEPSDDIPDPEVPPALLKAVTGTLEPSAAIPERFGEHQALLQGFCQVLQGKIHEALYTELKDHTAALEASYQAVHAWAEKLVQANEHAQYQLSAALTQLQEHGLGLRSDPYTASVTARSPEGFGVTITLAKADASDLTSALPALLAWLAQSRYTRAE
jgi:hypothetical protein